MLAYLRRHHIGLLALFIALGGTSYAAAKLPRNSVGAAQLRSGAVTEGKLAQGVRDQLGRTVVGSPGAPGSQGPAGPQGLKGDKGDTGAQGLKGDTGAQGLKGDTGLTGKQGDQGTQGAKGDQGIQGVKGDKGDAGAQGIPGPTSGGVGGVNNNITPAAGAATAITATSVTLTQPGRVLVMLNGTFSVRCTSADDCDRTLSVTVGGTTVPGAFATINGEAGVNTEGYIDTAGILTNVPAGTHQVQIRSLIEGPTNGNGNKGDVRIVALALGG